jgi:FtsH-binding integral membrane protein
MVPIHLVLVWTVLPVGIATLLVLAATRSFGPSALWPAAGAALIGVAGTSIVAFWRPSPDRWVTAVLFVTALYALPMLVALHQHLRGAGTAPTWQGMRRAVLLAAGLSVPWGLILGVAWIALDLSANRRSP